MYGVESGAADRLGIAQPMIAILGAPERTAGGIVLPRPRDVAFAALVVAMWLLMSLACWRESAQAVEFTGAGEGIRTLDPNLGKVVLYP